MLFSQKTHNCKGRNVVTIVLCDTFAC
jgi:hypothetical protein